MNSNSTYHSLLRIASVVVSIMLVFSAGLISSTTTLLTQNTQQYLANAVGVSVGVAPNEFNQITAALTAQKQQLDARELALSQREIEVSISGGSGAVDNQSTTFVLTIILFILLVLIIINYALDYARYRERLSYRATGV